MWRALKWWQQVFFMMLRLFGDKKPAPNEPRSFPEWEARKIIIKALHVVIVESFLDQEVESF